MKTIKQILTVVVLVFLMLGSFSGNAQSFKPSDFKYIGIEHNEMLDNLYIKLKNENYKNTENNFKNLIIDVYENYMISS
ncbi:MAG TPA: hypothetical protein ENK67_07900, partial [Flavobacteriia bacterium]|nr:hypothetical protein [Flavobacteriia bacterium]